jgi:hypothetical protein
MRILVVLLSFLILVLSGFPCCADDCSEKAVSEQQEAGDPGDELCSPFLNCGTCNAVVLPEEPSEMPFLEPVSASVTREAVERPAFEFSFRIWQPPRSC